jgi:SAM-dependent methyltransferase
MGYFVSLIPTADDEVGCFFEIAPVTESDVVYDLGSGDGRLVFAAVMAGAGRAVGVELNPAHVEGSRQSAKKRGLDSKVTFVEADLMEVDLSEATLVVTYLFSTASAALKPKFEAELKPGARVVMESFPVHGWKPDRIMRREHRTFYLYEMPPVPDGRWPEPTVK